MTRNEKLVVWFAALCAVIEAIAISCSYASAGGPEQLAMLIPPTPTPTADHIVDASKKVDARTEPVPPYSVTASVPLVPRRAVDESELSADAQPTPWPGVKAMLQVATLRGGERLLDPGCGPDARLLIAACEMCPQWNGKALGIEINPDHAEAARLEVERHGLSERIQIVTGDSTAMNIKTDVLVGYMWPEFWASFFRQLDTCDRVVSYEFPIPGFQMDTTTASNGGKVYSWKRAPVTTRVPVTRTTSKIVQLPRGSYCEVCHGHCRNPMAHVREQQIVGYKTVPAAQQTERAGGHYVTRQVCQFNSRGQRTGCKMVKTWVPD